jgi:mono/diheme cytochrome c family protein
MTPGFPSSSHRSKRLFVAFLHTVCVGVLPAAEPPVVPGLDHKHPLNERQVGTVLLNELRCASCHEGVSGTDMKAAPDLKRVGERLRFDYLQKFIADPAAMHPGSTMPSLLASESEESRKAISESIAHYLLSLQAPAGPKETAAKAGANTGRSLFHGIGCIACHSPRDDSGKELSTSGDLSLSHVPAKFQDGALAEFLLDPLKVRPSGRMPDMNLSRDEAASLASYLMGESPAVESQKPDAGKAAAGKAAFKTLNCTACHQLEDPELGAVRSGPPLGKLDPMRGCLSEAPTTAPNFHLSASQVKSIRSALADSATPPSSADRIKLRLTQLNCISCHVRDDFGGVAPDRDSFFHSSEAALGNEARIPPPLTQIGAKLRPEWLNRVLYDRERVRPYMETRMPHYGEIALKDLPALFAEVDHLGPIAAPKHGPADPDEPSDPDDLSAQDRNLRNSMRTGAQQLLGDTGLNCISCHNFNGTESQGMKGLDLMTSFQRLQPEWFDRYMRNPAAFRPGIIMPNYWPDGKATQTTILDGNTDLQIKALWDTFSLGRSAKDPSGLRSPDIKLVVTDKPVMHRGRSRIASYRGIAVGFPGGTSLAFNAQNGSLAALWKGEFVNVNWKSQGAGDFTPIGKTVNLPPDVAFLQLKDEKRQWPLMPVLDKPKMANPDPLYPRQHGYAFTGYSLDDALIPTFSYRCGDISIEDKSAPNSTVGANTLRRTFKFTSAKADTVYFRALTGKIESESAMAFKTPQLRLSLSQGQSILRPMAGREGEQELLIKLTLPKGASTFTVDYALLP